MTDETFNYSFTSSLSSGAYYEVDIWKGYLMFLRGFGPEKTVWATELTPDLLKDIKALSDTAFRDEEVADAIFERFYSPELRWRAIYDNAAWERAFIETFNGREWFGTRLETFEQFELAFGRYAEYTFEPWGPLLPYDEMPTTETLAGWWESLVEQFPEEEAGTS